MSPSQTGALAARRPRDTTVRPAHSLRPVQPLPLPFPAENTHAIAPLLFLSCGRKADVFLVSHPVACPYTRALDTHQPVTGHQWPVASGLSTSTDDSFWETVILRIVITTIMTAEV